MEFRNRVWVIAETRNLSTERAMRRAAQRQERTPNRANRRGWE